MIEEKECELKLLLTEMEYSVLSEIFIDKKINEISQTNFYFDTGDSFFHGKNTTLRLREIDDEYQLTIKEKMAPNKKLHFRKAIEKNISISSDLANHLIDRSINISEIPAFCKAINPLYSLKVMDVRLLGSLITYRHSYDYLHQDLCLDENLYLDTKDWELEFESFDTNLISCLLNQLSNCGISLNKTLQGKYSRFLSRYVSLRNII